MASLFQKRGNNSFQSAAPPKSRFSNFAENQGDKRSRGRLNIQIFSINLRIFEVEATFSFTSDRHLPQKFRPFATHGIITISVRVPGGGHILVLREFSAGAQRENLGRPPLGIQSTVETTAGITPANPVRAESFGARVELSLKRTKRNQLPNVERRQMITLEFPLESGKF